MFTCNYTFPLHPREMFENSPKNMKQTTKTMRVQIIKYIIDFSQSFSNTDLNEKLYLDIDKHNKIVGFDMSNLLGVGCNMCVGRRVKLGDVKAEDWINMKIM